MIVLASRSPRRRKLLEMLGIEHEVEPADIEETLLDGEDAIQAAPRLALEKARHVAGRKIDNPVLAADTIVVLDGKMLGKPKSPEEAVAMLKSISGVSHFVVTGVAMVWPGGESTLYDRTRVEFVELSDEMIRAYVATGEPLDKAGSYGIQGLGAPLVNRIEGDYFSVQGLPLRLVVRLMAEAGVPYRFTR
jgi:nucleoside triphosphate pyrophosphatase